MREPVRVASLACRLLLFGCASAEARQAPSYSIDLGAERSHLVWAGRDVNWWTSRLQLNAREAPGKGWFVAAESQKRERDTDVALGGGLYGRAGPWLWSGQLSAAPGASFLPRYAIEPQVGVQLGSSVVQAGYIYRSFHTALVRIATFSATHYVGDSEIELKLAHGSTQPFDRHIRVATLRGLYDPGGAWNVGASASVGKGLYDILNLPGTTGNRGWTTSVNVRYRIDTVNSLRLDLGAGHENPGFRERRIGLSFRKSF
jgi:YaiO family outer membrane protein